MVKISLNVNMANGNTSMNEHRLYQQLLEDVRRYFRYEAEPTKQLTCTKMMRGTMRKILDLQERTPDNDEQQP